MPIITKISTLRFCIRSPIRIISLILALILFAASFTFTGCEFFDDTPEWKNWDDYPSFLASNRDGDSNRVSSYVEKPDITLDNPNMPDWEKNFERAGYLSAKYMYDFYDQEQQKLYIRLDGNASATLWEYVAMMSMQAYMAVLDPEQIPLLDNVIEGLEYYGYKKHDELWGYVVNRGNSPQGATDPGLAYDDSMWLIIDLITAYDATQNGNYLQKAEEITSFILTEAWFEPLGGLFWDSRHDARHSCSNNPMIKPLVDLYIRTDNEYYLEWAKKVYDFSVSKLKNAENGLFYDWVKAEKTGDDWEDVRWDRSYYSYNSGAFISGAAALYGITNEQEYLDEALAASKAAFEYFGEYNAELNLVNFTSKTWIWFNSVLLRGYIDLYPYAEEETLSYIEAFEDSMDFAYENHLKDRYMPYDWLGGWKSGNQRDTNLESLDQSANAEMYALLAIWRKSISDENRPESSSSYSIESELE